MPIQPQPDISALLLKQQRKTRRVTGDGNCFFRAISLFLYDTQEKHHEVRRNIVEYESQHEQLFAPLIIDPTGKQTFADHLRNVKNPTAWASQIELQAAAELYSIPLYLYTQTPDKSDYHWLCYKSATSSTPIVKPNHIELAHPAGIHFDLIVDAATMAPSQIPPQLTGKNVVDPIVHCLH